MIPPARRGPARLAIAVAFGVTAAAAAFAQSPPVPAAGSPNGAPARGAPPPSRNSGLGLSTNARVPWPRLDPGAVVCRTREDLRLHARIVQARADGTHYDGAVPQCRIVDLPIAIDILSRESPAATEIKLRDAPASTAWTDTWLPSTPPR